jgi:hypothetical protein
MHLEWFFRTPASCRLSTSQVVAKSDDMKTAGGAEPEELSAVFMPNDEKKHREMLKHHIKQEGPV